MYYNDDNDDKVVKQDDDQETDASDNEESGDPSPGNTWDEEDELADPDDDRDTINGLIIKCLKKNGIQRAKPFIFGEV